MKLGLLVCALGLLSALSGCSTLRVEARPGQAGCAEVPDATLRSYLARIRAEWAGQDAQTQPIAAVLSASFPLLTARELQGAVEASRPRPFAGPIPTLEEVLARQADRTARSARAPEPILRAAVDAPVKLTPPTAEAHSSALLLRGRLSLFVPPALEAIERLGPARAESQTDPVFLVDPKNDFGQILAEAMQTGGDEALLWQLAIELEATQERPLAAAAGQKTAFETGEQIGAERSRVAEFEFAKTLKRYLAAYFRGGRILQAKLKVEQVADDFEKRLREVRPVLDESFIRSLKSSVLASLSQICKNGKDSGCLLTSPLGDDSLTLRHGSALQFAGVTLTAGFDGRVTTAWEYPKSAEFAPQLVRVAIEALFDSYVGHPPGVATSLACKKGLFRGFDPAVPLDQQLPQCLSEEVVAGIVGLEGAVADVDDWAARADSAVTIGVSTLVRGGYWIALNNETVARSAENLGGVMARKVTEHLAWRRTVELGCRIGEPPLLLKVVGG